VLFFIAHASRRVWLAGCTKNPSGEWVTQQARNLGLDFSERDVRRGVRKCGWGWSEGKMARR